MSKEDLDKIETIIGYLRPMYLDINWEKQLGTWHFMPAVIDEAEEWLTMLQADNIIDTQRRAKEQPKSKLAPGATESGEVEKNG